MTRKTRPVMKVVIAAAIGCALTASILSQARGAWLALPLCMAVLFYMMARAGDVKIKLKIVLPLLILVVVDQRKWL